MGNYLNLGKYADEARALLDAIKGGAIRQMELQFDALKKQFTDKLSAVNTELSAFKNQQKALVNTIFDDPDTRYQKAQPIGFKIEGDEDKFYPVIFGTANVNRLVDIHIGRNISTDGSGKGAMSIKLSCTSYAWGARAGTTILELLKTVHWPDKASANVIADGFVADYQDAGIHPHGFIVWLRGGYTYDFWCDGDALKKVSSTTDKQKSLGHDEAIVYLTGDDRVVNNARKTIDVLTARNTTTVPNFKNYERA